MQTATLFIKSGRRFIPAHAEAVINEAESIYAARFVQSEALTSPETAKNYLKFAIGTAEREQFLVVFLDNQHRVITNEILFQGTIDGAAVYPRVVAQKVLQHNAAAVILAHNHPSGLTEPSQADRNITQKIKEALNLLDIRTLDHFIVGEDIFSFAEHGLL